MTKAKADCSSTVNPIKKLVNTVEAQETYKMEQEKMKPCLNTQYPRAQQNL